VRKSFVEAAVAVVEGAGGLVLFVELTCSESELERRVEDDSRARFGKLRSTALFQELRQAGAFDYPKLPAGLTLDTSTLTPEEAALRIRSHFELE
jgi:hypothetical protein